MQIGEKIYNIGKSLKNNREKAGETQEKISELLKTTQQQYWKYEHEIQEIPLRHIIKLAEHYNITIDQLLGLEETRITLNEELIEIAKKYISLNEKRKGKAELFIEQLKEQQDEEEAKSKESA